MKKKRKGFKKLGLLVLNSIFVILLLSACSTSKVDGVKNEVFTLSKGSQSVVPSNWSVEEYIPKNVTKIYQVETKGEEKVHVFRVIEQVFNSANSDYQWLKTYYDYDASKNEYSNESNEAGEYLYDDGLNMLYSITTRTVSGEQFLSEGLISHYTDQEVYVDNKSSIYVDSKLYDIDLDIGTFSDCLKVTTSDDDMTITTYYAKDIGEIYKEWDYGNSQIVSELVNYSDIDNSSNLDGNTDKKGNPVTNDSVSDDWNQVFKSIMSNENNTLPVNEEFGLFDFDNNGTPELIVGGWLEYHIYKMDSNGSAIEVGTIFRAKLYLDEYNSIIAECSFGAGSTGIARYELTDGEGFIESYVLESEEGVDYSKYTYYGETIDKDEYEEENDNIMNSVTLFPLYKYDGINLASIELSDYIYKR